MAIQSAYNNLRVYIFLAISFFTFQACDDTPKSKKKVKTVEVLFKKEGELSIVKQKADTLIAKIDIEIAETDYETQTGLMYRKSMEKSKACFLSFPMSDCIPST